MDKEIEIDPRWQKVLDRDETADGEFVYAVRTTGIYCRPSCPSRRAKVKNVQFFAGPDEAEEAGYRQCQRCTPRGQSLQELNTEIVIAACRLIEGSGSQPNLSHLAKSTGLSTSHFSRVFKAATGLSPKAYGVAHRNKKLRDKLANDDVSVTTAIYDAGFNSNSRFYENSNDFLGMTPSTFKKGGANTEILFAVGQCSLGAILVARSKKGICAITLGDDALALVHDLQDRFPKAELVGGDEEFERQVAQVVGFVETPGLGLNLPLDIQGTVFQQRVWNILREIPAGETRTYAEVAKMIGDPKSARAVAQACASNRIAVAIPCHRVVRSNGELSGYRWGVERKRALLTLEAKA
ncbi:bifunctional transcriptional regulator/O6-methylguanine-DNA methyltransferase [Roseibium algicola]|uniref:Bifunctional transcriptional regulator/O6-methylguanine-DNA methyltransferase n=1 Tax=Roseibium algicola TaxID=2857014 RepID=A0ABN4X2Q4_9HYPH|nr:bifunctional DNA-binding transcriptional regulator/O6-methylguanine-DNA methyltransferase Ada [Roseibium aggregatum]AQQ05372.1 bifunctional transcriptional regulator/O6-methylguanine-DNA methyltransferase [Roseibium aggregatum]